MKYIYEGDSSTNSMKGNPKGFIYILYLISELIQALITKAAITNYLSCPAGSWDAGKCGQ